MWRWNSAPGAVKITPAHDPNDFEVGVRCGLPVLRVFTDDGHINELGGAYEGLTTMECRKQLVADHDAAGNLVKVEPYAHNVGTATAVIPRWNRSFPNSGLWI